MQQNQHDLQFGGGGGRGTPRPTKKPSNSGGLNVKYGGKAHAPSPFLYDYGANQPSNAEPRPDGDNPVVSAGMYKGGKLGAISNINLGAPSPAIGSSGYGTRHQPSPVPTSGSHFLDSNTDSFTSAERAAQRHAALADLSYGAAITAVNAATGGGTRLSGTKPGQILSALATLTEVVDRSTAKLDGKLKKKKLDMKFVLKGDIFKGDPKVAKTIKELVAALKGFTIRLASQADIMEGVPILAVVSAFTPISKNILDIAYNLLAGGDEVDGFVKFSKSHRKEIGEELRELRVSVLGVVNLVLGAPLKQSSRMSNRETVERMFQSGQQTVSMLKRAENAWMDAAVAEETT